MRARPLVAAAALSVLVAVALVVGAGPAAAPNDPGLPRQWSMSIIGAQAAWDGGGRGRGITIAVLDSGVHLTHEDINVPGKLMAGRNYISAGRPPQDDNGHGTHVAGIAAAAIDNGKGVVGVAPEARVLPVKMFSRDGYSTVSTEDAIRWAVDNGAQVINMSFSDAFQPLFGSSDDLIEGVRYAWSKGVICVAAAGNEIVLSSGFADEPAIVVTATDRNDGRAGYASTVGGAQWGMSAPGGGGGGSETVDVLSTFWERDDKPNSYASMYGTSMAAPHVAGAAAVLRGLGLTPQQTVDRLLQTAKDLGSPGRDNTYGWGRLDVAKAVSGLVKAPPPNSGGTATTASTARPPAPRSPTTAAPSRTVPRTPARSPAPAAPTTAAPAPPEPAIVEAPTTTSSTTTPDLTLSFPRPRPEPDDDLPLAAVGVAIVLALAASGATARRLLQR